MRQIFLAVLVLSAAGCQWVKPTEGGDSVALVKAAHIANCKKLGATRSSVKSKIGFVERKERKVTDELVTLAKNEAAKMGGDTVVAVGEMAEGSQKFDIYSCE